MCLGPGPLPGCTGPAPGRNPDLTWPAAPASDTLRLKSWLYLEREEKGPGTAY